MMAIDDDLLNDPEYQAFVEGQRKHCGCDDRYCPCDGVLAGGMCDDIHDDSHFDEDDDFDEDDYQFWNSDHDWDD